MGGLVTRLQNLVQVSLDPAAPLYVLRNLKTPQDHCGSRIVMQTHKLAIIRLLTLRSRSPSPDDELIALVFQAAIPRFPGEQRVPLVGLPNNPLKNLLEKGNGLPMMIAKEQMQKELLFQQIEAIRLQAAVLKDMERFDPFDIAIKMRDANPLVRWLAIQSAAQRRLHCEDELINRLKDPVPAVRAAARDALVRISRGADFGPVHAVGPTLVATRNAQDEAVARWRQWLKSQSDTPSPTTESPGR